MNTVVQSGRMTKDAEISTYDKGSWIKIVLAVKKAFNDRKEGESDAYFRNVRYWVKTDSPKILEYLKKGTCIIVSGEWRTNITTNESGVKKYWEEIIARELDILEYAPVTVPATEEDEDSDDLGF